jgi:hypothetical protein
MGNLIALQAITTVPCALDCKFCCFSCIRTFYVTEDTFSLTKASQWLTMKINCACEEAKAKANSRIQNERIF